MFTVRMHTGYFYIQPVHVHPVHREKDTRQRVEESYTKGIGRLRAMYSIIQMVVVMMMRRRKKRNSDKHK